METFTITNKSSNQYPLGATLLRLRGAIQNLAEALRSSEIDLILTRRKELYEVLTRFTVNNSNFPRSLVTSRLIHNLNIEAGIAKSILHDASSFLSRSLVLA